MSNPDRMLEVANVLRDSAHLTPEETARVLLQRYLVLDTTVAESFKEIRTLGQADVVAAIREIRWSEVPEVQEDLNAIHDTIDAAIDPFDGAAAMLDGNDE